jgi:hypothetical protein
MPAPPLAVALAAVAGATKILPASAVLWLSPLAGSAGLSLLAFALAAAAAAAAPAPVELVAFAPEFSLGRGGGGFRAEQALEPGEEPPGLWGHGL